MNEFRFERPELLWLLLLVPPALISFLIWAWRKRQRLLGEFIEPRLLASLTAGVSPKRRKLRYALFVVSVVFLIITLAQPQWNFDWEETKQHGLDVVVAIDASKSMLAEDIAPNRLARAKLATQDLMQLAKSDRLGLVAFSGVAFLMCPLTVDDGAFKQSLDTLDVNTLPQGGTDISGAIKTAMSAFKEDPDNHKILVLFSDGEDHDEGAVEAAKKAAEKGLRIFTVGIGSPEGEILRIKQSDGSAEFIRDADGNVVKSRLNEELLREIATAGRGFYLPLRGAKTIDTLYESGLAPLPKNESSTRLVKHYHQQFFWPLAFALMCLIAEILIPERNRELRVARAAMLLIALLGFAGNASASPASAMQLYKAGKFEEAFQEYQRLAEQEKQGDMRLQFNAGTAAYRATNTDAAIRCFTAVLSAKDVKLQQAAYFNLGNTHFKIGEAAKDLDPMQKSWETAIKFYQNAVTLDKNDADANYNLEFVKNLVQQLIQFREWARRAKAEADEAVRQRYYHRALEIVDSLVQSNPAAKPFKDFADKLKDIDSIVTPQTQNALPNIGHP